MKLGDRKFWMSAVLAAMTAAFLSACAPVMFGSAVGGVLVATDRRTAGMQLEDENIELRSASRLRENLGDRGHVNVTSYNRQVLLTGEVPNAQDKQLVEQIVSRVENVRSIVNELVIAQPSSLAQRSTDALTTARIKASMVDSKDIFANAYKVVTERGTAYLMGRVTQREADRATEIARSVGSVQKVVRIFEILTEDELRALQPPPPPPKADEKK
ncbi:MAG: BON domain-containing protein [Gammaproteobacteria bacterium]|nr:BON domain-containing protein [Gammaproteobacteria bacterium]MBU0788048.1 BON domain-containing protein [Gammaproteobacteria bacterium]MBU0815454.1 BON domain-containing protein [Gammaproteobacteria bacterium]MBU1785438.1 BON domain-containing protein [Gammaproteobacteria bacterium]